MWERFRTLQSLWRQSGDLFEQGWINLAWGIIRVVIYVARVKVSQYEILWFTITGTINWLWLSETSSTEYVHGYLIDLYIV